jgi:hypothetical protein
VGTLPFVEATTPNGRGVAGQEGVRWLVGGGGVRVEDAEVGVQAVPKWESEGGEAVQQDERPVAMLSFRRSRMFLLRFSHTLPLQRCIESRDFVTAAYFFALLTINTNKDPHKSHNPCRFPVICTSCPTRNQRVILSKVFFFFF